MGRWIDRLGVGGRGRERGERGGGGRGGGKETIRISIRLKRKKSFGCVQY